MAGETVMGGGVGTGPLGGAGAGVALEAGAGAVAEGVGEGGGAVGSATAVPPHQHASRKLNAANHAGKLRFSPDRGAEA